MALHCIDQRVCSSFLELKISLCNESIQLLLALVLPFRFSSGSSAKQSLDFGVSLGQPDGTAVLLPAQNPRAAIPIGTADSEQ